MHAQTIQHSAIMEYSLEIESIFSIAVVFIFVISLELSNSLTCSSFVLVEVVCLRLSLSSIMPTTLACRSFSSSVIFEKGEHNEKKKKAKRTTTTTTTTTKKKKTKKKENKEKESRGTTMTTRTIILLKRKCNGSPAEIEIQH